MKPESGGSSEHKGLSEQEVAMFEAHKRNVEIDEQNRLLKHLLFQLVFQIFLVVADADGEIDSKEITAFRSFLGNRSENCSNSYTKRLFHVTLKSFVLLLDQYRRKKIKKDFDMIEKTMVMVGKIVSIKMMKSICSDLNNMAEAIAKASGGFIGLGSKISKEEANVIEDIKTAFKNATAASVAYKKKIKKPNKSVKQEAAGKK